MKVSDIDKAELVKATKESFELVEMLVTKMVNLGEIPDGPVKNRGAFTALMMPPSMLARIIFAQRLLRKLEVHVLSFIGKTHGMDETMKVFTATHELVDPIINGSEVASIQIKVEDDKDGE